MAEKPQNMTTNRGSTPTGPGSATLADLATSGAERYPRPGGRSLSPCEDGCTFGIALHSRYFRPSRIIDQGYASATKLLRPGQQPDFRWPQRVPTFWHYQRGAVI